MELTFNQVGKQYIAEFTASADFNLHIEKHWGGGVVNISKCSVDEEGATYVQELKMGDYQSVLDKDFSEKVYPKHYRIVSNTQYLRAFVTSEGEISGGGGMAYFDVRGKADSLGELFMFAYCRRLNTGEYTGYVPPFVIQNNLDSVEAVSIPTNVTMRIGAEGSIFSTSDIVSQFEETGAVRITREQFYGELPKSYTFTVEYDGYDIEPTTYKYDEGMTWEDWCNSSYNIHGFEIDYGVIGYDPKYHNRGLVADSFGNGVEPHHKIIDSERYLLQILE